jgi:hypothetical protein
MQVNAPSTIQMEKRKLKGWRATVGGGYDHQFFNSKELDTLTVKEENWLEFLK